MRDLFASLAVPLRSLVVAAGGAYLSSLWLSGTTAQATVVIVISVILGYLLDMMGRNVLPEHPVAAVRLMEGWLLVPLVVGVTAAALIVAITVALASPGSASPEEKEVAKAYTAALAAFLTATAISRDSDRAESPIARRIRRAFRDAYPRSGTPPARVLVQYLEKDTLAERLVYSDEVAAIQGWGYNARRVRAKRLYAELH